MIDKSGTKTSYYSSGGALVTVDSVTAVATAVVAAVVAAATTIAATAAVVDCYVFVTPSLDFDDAVISSPPRSISMMRVVGGVTHNPLNAHRRLERARAASAIAVTRRHRIHRHCCRRRR